MAERHVREGERHVRNQREIVRFLREHGHPVELAETLLANLEDMLEMHRGHAARLKAAEA
jgi:hypothetical protein